MSFFFIFIMEIIKSGFYSIHRIMGKNILTNLTIQIVTSENQAISVPSLYRMMEDLV